VDEEYLELEAELRRAVSRFDPPPTELRRAAVESFSWRTVDAELAELVFDSSATDVVVRSHSAQRLLTFQAGAMSIHLEISRRDRSCALVGQLEPPQPATVRIRRAAGSIDVEADELGRFRADALPSGPVSLHWRAGGGEVVTDWISL